MEMTWMHINHDLLTEANQAPILITTNTKYQETRAFIGWAKSHDLTTLQGIKTPTVFNRKYWFHGSSEIGRAQTLRFILRVFDMLHPMYIYTLILWDISTMPPGF